MTKIKATAATKAANKPAAIRQEVLSFRDQINEKQKSLNATLFDAAMWCRKNKATPEELQELLDVITKQKRSDFKRIVTAPDDVVTKSMPQNLVQAAQYIRARVKGAPAATAKSYATGKLDAAGLAKKLGEKAPEKAGRKSGDTHEADKPAPTPEQVGNLSRLNDLLPALESEMSEYGPEVKKAMKAFKAAADALIKAAANG